MEIFKFYNYPITIVNLIDLLLLLAVLYKLYSLLKGSLAFNMMAGLLTIYIAWIVVRFLKMPLMENVLGEFTKVGFLAILIVFQQEIRKFLLLLGRGRLANNNRSVFRFLPWNWKVEKHITTNYDDIIDACEIMAASYTGALIIFPKTSEMKFIGDSGEMLDAQINRKLLLSIFNKNSPLHDGAVIIVNNKIKVANSVLPVSENPIHQSNYGLRHLAAIGITEQTDAIALVVSEERGNISIAKQGQILENLSRTAIIDLLNKEFSKAITDNN